LTPVKPCIATTFTASRQDCSRCASRVLSACFEPPSTISSSRDGSVPSQIPMGSMITVTYLSTLRAGGDNPVVVVEGPVAQRQEARDLVEGDDPGGSDVECLE
jgi:hypothetical protein